MLAEHAIGRETAPGQWRLTLEPSHDTLLNEAQVAAVERSLAAHLGMEVALTVEVADPGAETPAQRRDREARERKERAIATLEADQTVQKLVAEFDGRLDVDSVKPRE